MILSNYPTAAEFRWAFRLEELQLSVQTVSSLSICTLILGLR